MEYLKLSDAARWLAEVPASVRRLKEEDGAGNPFFLEAQSGTVSAMLDMAIQQTAPNQKLSHLLLDMLLMWSNVNEDPQTDVLGKGVYNMANALGPEGRDELKAHILALTDLKAEIGMPLDMPNISAEAIRSMVNSS